MRVGTCYCRRESQLPGVCMLVAVHGAGQGSVRDVRQAGGSLDSVTGETSAHSLDGAGEWHWACRCQWIPPVYHRPVEASRPACLGCWNSSAVMPRVSLSLLGAGLLQAFVLVQALSSQKMMSYFLWSLSCNCLHSWVFWLVCWFR